MRKGMALLKRSAGALPIFLLPPQRAAAAAARSFGIAATRASLALAPAPAAVVQLLRLTGCRRCSSDLAAPETPAAAAPADGDGESGSIEEGHDANVQPARRGDPLRILFFGSDEFSVRSLTRLDRLMKEDPGLIKSIDVVGRQPKLTGRGLKTLTSVPVFESAKLLGLQTHTLDSFDDGWEMPTVDGEPINLIIAVSFGLFIPTRIIDAAKYGGLNVHPSLLPDLRGAAPVQWAIILNRSHTGVTVQTLDSKRFDRGLILAQTPLPGLPVTGIHTGVGLKMTLANKGAGMLARVLKYGLHLPPLSPLTFASTTPGEQEHPPQHTALARKVTKEDQEVRWDKLADGRWTAADVERRFRAFGSLWALAVGPSSPSTTRVLFTSVRLVPFSSLPQYSQQWLRGLAAADKAGGGGTELVGGESAATAAVPQDPAETAATTTTTTTTTTADTTATAASIPGTDQWRRVWFSMRFPLPPSPGGNEIKERETRGGVFPTHWIPDEKNRTAFLLPPLASFSGGLTAAEAVLLQQPPSSSSSPRGIEDMQFLQVTSMHIAGDPKALDGWGRIRKLSRPGGGLQQLFASDHPAAAQVQDHPLPPVVRKVFITLPAAAQAQDPFLLSVAREVSTSRPAAAQAQDSPPPFIIHQHDYTRKLIRKVYKRAPQQQQPVPEHHDHEAT